MMCSATVAHCETGGDDHVITATAEQQDLAHALTVQAVNMITQQMEDAVAAAYLRLGAALTAPEQVVA